MLKVRLMGTKNDITWFGKILNNNSKIEVTEFSDLYPNKGTKKFYRAYVEVRKSNVAEKSQKTAQKKENVSCVKLYQLQTKKVVWVRPVSYTHLDVYKRQAKNSVPGMDILEETDEDTATSGIKGSR